MLLFNDSIAGFPLAWRIARKTHGKLFRIEREIPYSADYSSWVYNEIRKDADQYLRPAILGRLPDKSKYDAVIVACYSSGGTPCLPQ